MEKRSIDLRALFSLSYAIFKQHTSFIIGVTITFLALALVPQIYAQLYSPEAPSVSEQIVGLGFTLVQLFVVLGFTRIMFLLVDPNQPVDISDYISNGKPFFSFSVAHFLFFIIVAIGCFLLILPGVYLYLRLQFYPYYIIEDDCTSFSALQKSWYATKNMVLELFLLVVCIAFINFLGILCLGVGFIFTYPLTTMATAIVYRGIREGNVSIPAEETSPTR